MNRGPSTLRIMVVGTGPGLVPGAVGLGVPHPSPRRPGSCRLRRRDEMLGQAFEVQDPADEVRLLADAGEPSASEAPEAMPLLPLAEELLDQFAAALREPIRQAHLLHPHARVGRAAAARL